MHKKRLIAVLVLGLLLCATVLAYAEVVPKQGADERVRVVTQAPTAPDEVFTVPAGPIISVQGGTVRTVPGVACDGNWMIPVGTSFTNAWGVPGSLPRNTAVYQDPNTLGDCAPGSYYTFDVLAVDLYMAMNAPTTGGLLQGIVFEADLSDPAGPKPGAVIQTTPVYSFTLPIGGYAVSLPFTIECCVTGPYFACVRAIGGGWGNPSGPYVTGTTLTDRYNWRTSQVGGLEGPWQGNYSFGGSDRYVWSDGVTPDDLTTHCTPGLCDWQWWYVGSSSDCGTGIPGERQNDCWFANHPIPDYMEVDLNGERPEMWVRYEAVGLDTLQAIEVLMGAFAQDATMSMRVSVYDADPVNVSPVCGGKIPGALRGFVDVPGPFSLAAPTYVDLSAIPVANRVFGTLNGGPIKSYFVGLSLTPGVDPDYNDLAVAFGDVIQDFVNPICPGTPPHSGAFFSNYQGAGPQQRYLGEFMIRRGAALLRYRHGEIWMDAKVCKEKVPIVELSCGAGGTDVWNQWGHDARRTSATNINVGDPNGIKLEWSVGLLKTNSFCSPTIANDRIYISTDAELSCYDLATPTLLGTFAGIPEMGSSNRGNTTIDAAGDVYATGGNFNAITKLGPNLESSGIIWSNNGTYSTAGNIPKGLADQNRFNTSVVANVSGTDVLFVATEPSAGAGKLYAFLASTGALWANWATNPVVLDQALKHGPSYDAGYLYCGTAIGGVNNTGSLYKIDATNGAIKWGGVGWTDVVGDGWAGGVSLEGNFLYGATRNADNSGRRYKLDVSSNVTPSIVWKSTQGLSLYGAPTIGRSFVYFPQDNPAFGVLMVDKTIGVAVHNFATEGIGQVPMNATLTCDKYLFAADRLSQWWLFNTTDQTAEWFLQYPIVDGGLSMGISGTALASHSTNGYSYAAISIRKITSAGRLSVYRLNTGPRPRLAQYVYDVTVPVPFGANITYTENGVFQNVGNLPLNFTGATITDPLPDGMSASVRSNLRTRQSLVPMDADYNQYFTDATMTKTQFVAGLTTAMVDGESIYSSYAALAKTSNRSEARAAGAMFMRISNVKINSVLVPTSLAAGVVGDLTFDVNGSVPYLGRGIDLNVINLANNDPDFDFAPPFSVAEVNVTLVGGCPEANTKLNFNDVPGGANNRKETMYTYGSLGDDNVSLDWKFDPQGTANVNLYDGSLVLVGPSLPPNADVRFHLFDNDANFVGNSAPGTGSCGFERHDNIVLGKYRSGGFPGTAVDIHGEWIQCSYSDTDFVVAPGVGIGVNVTQTEVGSYDPLYGDFKLIRYDIINRKAVSNGPIYAGSYIDWDVNDNSGNNVGAFDNDMNGYYIWDNVLPGLAFGAFDPNQPTGNLGLPDPSLFPPYRIGIYDNSTRQTTRGWNTGFVENPNLIYNDVVDELPLRIYDLPGNLIDRSGILFNQPITLAPLGNSAVHQAIFGMDAHGGTPGLALMKADAKDIAHRAARWAGFARGDVNEDGVVNLGDVAWIVYGGYPLYPGNYCGDVNADGLNNAADITRLLSYVSGSLANRPLGAWRF